MKNIFYIVFFSLLFVSCSRENEIDQLKAQIDSLKQNSYKPGFGEFMSYVQVHHAKLWFAGQNQNWQLAEFELKEINESLEDIQRYEKDRKESEMVIMLKPLIDSVDMSIKQKDMKIFISSFTGLTNKCNYCHNLNNYGFNVVKIPDTPPFSNQEFKKGIN